MDAFDMISEPVLFVQQLCEHAGRVHQCVELLRSLADELLAEDCEKISALGEQMSRVRNEAAQSEIALCDQIEGMYFHSAGGYAFGQYLACQDKVAASAQDFADLLVLRRTAIPAELRDDFRLLVTGVVNVGGRALSLAEGLASETLGSPGVARGTIDDDRARRREMDFARHLYSLEKPLGPVTVMFLDKVRAALHEVAGNAGRAADHLRRMIR